MPLNKFIRVLELGWMTGLLVMDQWTKLFASQRDLVIHNRGSVLGILPSNWWPIIIMLILVWLVIEWHQEKVLGSHFGMGLLIVGGVGNLLDRLLVGAVRDFIYYPMFHFYGNLADIVLAVGIGLVIISQVMIKFRHDVPPPNTI